MVRKLVFVSCGQETGDETALGQQLCLTIDDFPGAKSFYAQLVHSPGDLNSEVFSALHRCDAFFAVMHDRGTVSFGKYEPASRGSVWIHQEIAILCYRMFFQKRRIPTRVYAQEGVLLEGVTRVPRISISIDRMTRAVRGMIHSASGSLSLGCSRRCLASATIRRASGSRRPTYCGSICSAFEMITIAGLRSRPTAL